MSAPAAPRVQIPEFDQADRLRKSLRVSSMSVSDMADFLGIARETAGRYMNGHGRVPIQTLRVWAMATGVPFEWLKDGVVPSGLLAETPGPQANQRTLDYKYEQSVTPSIANKLTGKQTGHPGRGPKSAAARSSLNCKLKGA